jgi:hypothetical protein
LSQRLFPLIDVNISFLSLLLHNSYLCLIFCFFQEEKMLGILVQHKVRSGVSGIVGMEVDGMPFHGVHTKMIQKLLDISTEHV